VETNVRLAAEEVLVSTVMATVEEQTRPGRRERRARRRRLKRQDMLSGKLAELHAVGALLDQAVEVVRNGWTQHAWFTVDTASGQRDVTAYNLRLALDQPVVGACLVGAVVHAAGGPGTVRSQLVQRTLDVTWHALRDDDGRSVHWCPAPPIRTLRLLDLTSWNDAPDRAQHEVVELLVSARQLTEVQRARCHAEQAQLADTPVGV
jgi:hypothetical protein